jgi:8-oxo-dGTP pyrophosphatase MutT (NUDIX family)
LKLKLAVRCLILREGKVLVQVSRRGDFYKIPGGKLKPEETLIKTLEREMYEELGLQLKETPTLIAVIDSFYRDRGDLVHEIGFYFVCEVKGEPMPREDHIAVKWVNVRSADAQKIRPQALLELLEDLGNGNIARIPRYLVSVEL